MSHTTLSLCILRSVWIQLERSSAASIPVDGGDLTSDGLLEFLVSGSQVQLLVQLPDELTHL